jgi:tetratricopeptide (TPR) repeat protein
MHKGFSLLRQDRYGDALQIGRKLKRLRHSSAFEIIALAYLHQGLLAKAVATLEEGVAKAGRVWILWELLGNCYSDAGRYAAAEDAYQQALLREGCDADIVQLNRAIAFKRAGKLKQAWVAVQEVKSPRLLRRADQVRIDLSLTLGRKRTAAILALKLCQQRVSAEHLDSQSESSILLTCAKALKNAPATRPKVRRLALRAAQYNPGNLQALSLIRELDQQRAIKSSLYRLLIRGTWDKAFKKSKLPPGFFRSFDVSAPYEATAFRHTKHFFPRTVRSSLSVEECETLPGKATDFDGVYDLTCLIFYPSRRRQK